MCNSYTTTRCRWFRKFEGQAEDAVEKLWCQLNWKCQKTPHTSCQLKTFISDQLGLQRLPTLSVPNELCTHMQVVYCMWVASGDVRPGDCVGKADVSEAAGSPALSFPWWKGTGTLILQLVSRNSVWADTDLVSLRNSYLKWKSDFYYKHPGNEKPGAYCH